MMTFLAMALTAFVCFALVFYIKQRQFSSPAVRMPYQLKRPLFEQAERELLGALEQAAGERYRVLAKVRIADVVEVTAVPRRSYWHHATNRISAARFDFLLCDPHSLEPACAVEMEAASEANAFLDELCQTIGLPLVRLDAQQARSFAALRSFIDGLPASGARPPADSSMRE